MPQPSHVMALPKADERKLEPGMKKYFRVCKEKLGFVPNVLKAYAFRPKKLSNFVSFYNELMLGESRLSKLEREMVAVVVSSANHCYYCLVAHGQAVRQLSGDPELGEMLVANYRVAKLSKRHKTMLDFADKLTRTPHAVDESDRNSLKKNGFTPEEIFDLADVVGFFNMSNRVALALDMIPNRDYHRLNR